MRELLQKYLFSRRFWERVFSVVGIIAILAVGKDFIVFFITTFLCAYLFHETAQWIQIRLKNYLKKAPKLLQPLLEWWSKEKILLTVLYILFACICIIAIRDIGPTLTTDMITLLQSLSQRFSLDLGIANLKDTLSQWQSVSYQVWDVLNIISPSTDTGTLLSQLFYVGGIFFQVIFAYIVSFVWLLEYEQVKTYFSRLQQWPFSFFYHDLRFIFEKIKKSFGLVFQAQSKIAVANTILTVTGLLLIGFFYGQFSLNGNYIYPYILALACITFFTSFVPILGVFIGGIPIIFAGVVEYPGWWIVVALISMLFIVHAFEGYYLNPRIVGHSLNIPAPIIFLILFVAEHFMGIVGFFLWVPVYLLLMEFFESIGKMIEKIRN